MPALIPDMLEETSQEALIEQATTIPPVNRPESVNQTTQPAETSGEQGTTAPAVEKPASQVKAPAKRASLFFLAAVVLLVILLLGAFAYMTSAHMSPPKDELSPGHHSTQFTNATSPFSKPDSRSFHVEGRLQLTIQGLHSNVTIHTGDANTVTVMTSIPGDNQTHQAANNVTIQYTQSVDKQGRDHLAVATSPPTGEIDYTITVPAATQVRIEVASGSIVVDGINGATISTGGGNLDIADIHGPVHAYTDNGNITARGINGQTQIMSVNGSIRASNINGQLQAITQNGDVVVEGATLDGQSTLETTNGSVRFVGTIDPQGTCKMMTTRGNIDLTLPTNAAFQLDASTHSGSIHNAFGTTVTGTTPRASIMITIGNGGSITINKGAI
jgi:DUF4097 and DUF4098 domain-containing protein YvlB